MATELQIDARLCKRPTEFYLDNGIWEGSRRTEVKDRKPVKYENLSALEASHSHSSKSIASQGLTRKTTKFDVRD